jgi:hypothetical protein
MESQEVNVDGKASAGGIMSDLSRRSQPWRLAPRPPLDYSIVDAFGRGSSSAPAEESIRPGIRWFGTDAL